MAAAAAQWKLSATDVEAPFLQPMLIMSAFLAVAVVSCLLLLRGYVQHQKLKKKEQEEGNLLLPLPPGRMGLPFLGETLDFLRTARRNRSWEFLEDRVSGYGSETFKTSLLGFPTVVLASPAGNKMAFANIHVSWPKSVVDVIGSHSLIAHTGSHAHHLRHALHAFLNPYALQRYTHPLSRIVLASLPHPPHINNITSSASRSSPPPAEIELLAYPFMKKLSFSIVCHILVGIRVPADQDSLFHHFSTLVRGLFQIPIKIPGTRYSKAIAAASAIKKMIQTVIDKKRVEIASAESAAVSEHQDVLSGLLNFKDEDGKALSEEEIKDNIVLLLFAGNDTSSITATMACRYLALHPSIMDEVYEENKEIAEDKGPGEYSLQWEDLQKMKLTWRVVQETLRLQPPSQGSFRKATQDMSFDGYRIPKSWKIFWSVNSTQRNPRYFPEPEKFDPSRFEGAGPAPFTFVPFGGGQRMCPGNEFGRMEILIIIHYLVTHFSWTLKYPEEAITVDPMPIPVQGLPILLRRRATTTAA